MAGKSLTVLAQQVFYGMQSGTFAVSRVGGGKREEPIVRLVNEIIELGLNMRASDIHIEPMENFVRLRFRVDGILNQWNETFNHEVHKKIVARIKVMAGMDTTVRHLPADGHIDYKSIRGKIDIRVASIPTKYGETVVVRLLNAAERLMKLDELEFLGNNFDKFKGLIRRPNGMVIVTGPMNSGKTTTIYAALQELNSADRDIATVEDPVELILEGVNQTEVSAKLDFPAGLRALLRMDCDTLLIGEIRDELTAQIAVRAALTGHQIFTTLHAGDCVGAIFRLLDMNIPAYQIAATVSGIVAQRLVRRLCPHCREEYFPEENSEDAVLLRGENAVGQKFYRAVGCDECCGTGYSGRIALHEVLILDEDLRRKILAKDCTADSLRECVKENTLRRDGISKAAAGLTDLSEVRRVIYER